MGDESAEEEVICGGFWAKDLDFFRFPFCFGKQSLPGPSNRIHTPQFTCERVILSTDRDPSFFIIISVLTMSRLHRSLSDRLA